MRATVNRIEELKRRVSVDPDNETLIDQYINELIRTNVIGDFICDRFRKDPKFLAFRELIFKAIPKARIYLVGSKVYQNIIHYFHQSSSASNDWDLLLMGCTKEIKLENLNERHHTRNIKFDYEDMRLSLSLFGGTSKRNASVNHSQKGVVGYYYTNKKTKEGYNVDLISACDILQECPVSDMDLVLGRYLNKVPLDIQAVALDLSTRRLYSDHGAIKACYLKKVNQISNGVWKPYVNSIELNHDPEELNKREREPLNHYIKKKIENLPGFELVQ